LLLPLPLPLPLPFVCPFVCHPVGIRFCFLSLFVLRRHSERSEEPLYFAFGVATGKKISEISSALPFSPYRNDAHVRTTICKNTRKISFANAYPTIFPTKTPAKRLSSP
jgi:hypothetical protein